MKYPQEVEINIRFLKRKKVWYNLATNPKVISCGDAASKRERLGHVGIPIFDELKTELGYFIDKDKKKQKVLVHCRGNQKLDRLKISSILNSEYHRLSSNEAVKGLINPFGKKFRNLLQIFDISTTKKFHPPYTMMTNAGDFAFAFEFKAIDLISVLKNVVIDDVIRHDNYKNYFRHKIGILTGNGPDSGMLLWKKINESVKYNLKYRLNHSFRGDLSFPEIYIESIPSMGISMELDKREKATEETVIKSVIRLCQKGASIICIACNTTQYFKNKIDDICKLYGSTFISIPSILDEYLTINKINKFDFLGISSVADFDKYSAFKELNNKYEISIPKAQILKRINDIAFQSKKDNNRSANPLRDLIQRETKYDTVVIALTEISTVLASHKKILKNKTGIDTLQLMADRIGKMYVDGIFETLYIDREKDLISYDFLNNRSKTKAKSIIWNILCEIDYEFIPPLSYRDSTTFTFNSDTIEENKPVTYFNNLMKQEILISRNNTNENITGFMSYIPNYTIEHNNINIDCHYITTIGVTKGERGNGITNSFYRLIEEKVRKSNLNNVIATRTWSTNKTHIKILINMGYKQIILIKNDRGKGVHTVYFAKELIYVKEKPLQLSSTLQKS